jgi:hypothetical protein
MESAGNEEHGFVEFGSNRNSILAEIDRARNLFANHPVKVLHGKVAEAVTRRWLETFLPKRFGVTSGYILSQGHMPIAALQHFDVIVYDQLESPILWIEENPDQSKAGTVRAVPAEYVHGVLEVKVNLTRDALKEIATKLQQLTPYVEHLDDEKERYRRYFPKNFAMGFVVADVMAANANLARQFFDMCNSLQHLRGYCGGILLRGEGMPAEQSATLRILARDEEQKLASSSLLQPFNEGQSLSYRVSDELDKIVHLGSMLIWSNHAFQQFSFDFLARMRGNYEPGMVSSFHGFPFKIKSPKANSQTS